MRTLYCCLLLALFGGGPVAGGAAEYSRQAVLAAPVSAKDGAVFEVPLSTPVSRRRDMAQLEIVFSRDSLAKYTFARGGISSADGPADLVVTLIGDNGLKYSADIVNGQVYASGVFAKFVIVPPRKVTFRKMSLRGRNVPLIEQIYWLEGREKLATGVDEKLTHCEEGKCSWREAMDYCGSRGGRLLTRTELNSMYMDECGGRGPETCRARYWSSEEYAPFPRKAWYVDFSDGKGVSAFKIQTAYVRCMVPAGAAYKSGK